MIGRLCPEVLTAAQARVLARVAPVLAERSFYLAGGTALALRLGHRRSVDLDWFTGEPIGDPLRLAREVQEHVRLTVGGVERGTLHARISGVRVSLIEYRYPLLKAPEVVAGVPLASLEDLACMKLAAVAQRGALKDFIDIYALGRRIKLERMLALYRRKYHVADWGNVVFALTYFDDADRERMPVMLRRWSRDGIKRALRRWVAELAG